MALTYLGLGTNLGNKKLNLETAIQKIHLQIGEVLNVSSFYHSKAWGYESENDFLNTVILVDTHLPPLELLERNREIEKKMGRSLKTEVGYADRIIDIDILLYNNEVINLPELKIPHPHIENRDFVLYPLMEISPELIHPVLLRTMKELFENLKSKTNIDGTSNKIHVIKRE